MKVQLSITLEVPEEWASFSDEALGQLLSEGFVRVPRMHHLERIMDEMVKEASDVSEENKILARAAQRHHREFQEVCRVESWTMSRLATEEALMVSPNRRSPG